MSAFFTSLVGLVNEMAPYLLLGFLFAGILHVAVPRRFFRKYLAAENFRSVLWASLFGIPLPLCSCGVIPTAMGLRKEGASRGATTAFLTSTPQTGVDSILATYAVFGLAFAVMRPLAALVTSLLSGYFVSRLVPATSSVMSADMEKEGLSCGSSCNSCGDEQPAGIGKKIKTCLRYGFVQMFQDIGMHLLVGLLLAGVITAAVPDSFFLQFAKYPLLEMLAVLLVSVPMYVCATGSIPIAAALMLKGLTPGAALVLLMAGPATNAASIMVIRKVLGKKTMWLYLLGIITGAVLFGLGIDYFLPEAWFSQIHTTQVCCHAGAPWWKQASSIVFLLLLAHAMIRKYTDKSKIATTMKHKTVYRVKGMMCHHCKANVENNLQRLPGIGEVFADITDGTVTVTGTATEEDIKRVIESLGYEWLGPR